MDDTSVHPRMAYVGRQRILLTKERRNYGNDVLYTELNYLLEKWDAPRRNYKKWALEAFGFTNETLSLTALEKSYNSLLREALVAYNLFCSHDLIGTGNYIQQENEKLFSKILYTLSESYKSLQSRLRSISSLDGDDVQSSIITIFSSVRNPNEDIKPFEYYITFLLSDLNSKGYARYRGYCYRQISTKEGHLTHAWRPVSMPDGSSMTIEKYVNSAVTKEIHYNIWSIMVVRGNMQQAIHYLNNVEDSQFRTIYPNRHTWSFNNGIYLAKPNNKKKWTHAFLRYEDGSISNDIVACNYFDQEFPDHLMSVKDWYNDIPTPKFESILRYQKLHVKGRQEESVDDNGLYMSRSTEVCEWIYVLLGRMFFEVGDLDKWTVLPFFKGVAGSGKSTIGKHLKRVYGSGDVAIMSANMEEKFGLYQLSDKFIFICYEVANKMGIRQGDLQSVISGEDVSLPVKNRQPETRQWAAPGVFFGNVAGPFFDTQGSMTRRFVLVEFMNKVLNQHSDGNLDNDLCKEMSYFILKCCTAFKSWSKYYGNRSIWEILPPYFLDTQKRLRVLLNPLLAFIQGDEFEMNSMRYHPFSDFHTKFVMYLKTMGHDVKEHSSIDSFTSTFDECGLVTENGSKYWGGMFVNTHWIIGLGAVALKSDDINQVEVRM